MPARPKFNEKLLSELRVTTADKVGKLFCDFAPFLKMFVRHSSSGRVRVKVRVRVSVRVTRTDWRVRVRVRVRVRARG